MVRDDIYWILRKKIDSIEEQTKKCDPLVMLAIADAFKIIENGYDKKRLDKRDYKSYSNEVDKLINRFDRECSCKKK